jgi:D-serine deaminase-like pyridoxal phosphate-dependent protein
LNAGQNRTGVEKDKFQELLQFCNSLPGIQVVGMHVYDGHIDDESFIVRTRKAEEILGFVLSLKEKLPSNFKVVVGGTTTFPVYAQTEGLECSPGTFIYWDAGYKRLYKEQNFQIAALIATRVISKITDHLLCLDLGYKSISSENALEHRMAFMGRKAKIVKQYEEHLVVEVEDADKHKMGEVWYMSPVHICPTVALYDCIQLIEDHQFIGSQPTAGRQRLITV